MQFLHDGPEKADAVFVFAHGAGAPMDSPFMNTVSEGIAANGIRVARFEFPYMAERRRSGKRKGPDRTDVLEETWRTAIAEQSNRHVFIGGKSMGGRIATMVAANSQVAGVICFGYPFHPPGKPEKTRTAHLSGIEVPILIVQGTRDPFGKPDEIAQYDLSDSIRLVWLENGDHSFKTPKKAIQTTEELIDEAIRQATAFIVETSQ